jgi:hypothetical protein
MTPLHFTVGPLTDARVAEQVMELGRTEARLCRWLASNTWEECQGDTAAAVGG